MFLRKEQIDKYKIMSRKTCERYSTQNHEKSSIVISISSPFDRVAPAICLNEKNKIKDILFLSFGDVEKEDSPKHCMSLEDGKRIADFVNHYYSEVDQIIVHCDGGISRSAGVAAAIMRVKEGNDASVFRNKKPNITCYLRTLKGFGYSI